MQRPWANEKDKFARRPSYANFPQIRFIHKPIEELTVDRDHLEPVNVLTAGFPCQPFSVAGEKRGFSDERGLLFLHIIRLIREFGNNKPKILLLENVQNFRSHDKGRTFKRVQTEIQKAGYWFGEKNAKILNTATHTSIPQNRARIFMVAMSCDHFPSNTFAFPRPVPPNSQNPSGTFWTRDISRTSVSTSPRSPNITSRFERRSKQATISRSTNSAVTFERTCRGCVSRSWQTWARAATTSP